MEQYFRIGAFGVLCESERENLLAKEFHNVFERYTTALRPERIHLAITFRTDPWTPTNGAIRSGNFFFLTDGYVQREPYFDIHVIPSATAIKLHIHPIARKEARLDRFRAWLYAGSADYSKTIQLFSYAGLWSLMSVALPSAAMMFFHGGVVTKNNKAIALAGTGGCGKTSTTLRLVENFGFQYLSEDFSLLGADGMLFPSVRRLVVYRSDYIRLPEKQKRAVLDNMAWRNRLAWELSSALGRNPIRRLLDSEVFPTRQLGEPARLAAINFLVRGRFRKLEVMSIERGNMIERILASALRELKPLFELQCQSLAATGEPSVDLQSLRQRMCSVLDPALTGARLQLIRIPENTHPDSICEVIDGLAA